jgi:hypothetical protein
MLTTTPHLLGRIREVRGDVPSPAGVVDQDVEPAEPVDRGGDHRRQVVVGTHVDRHELRRVTDQLRGAGAVRLVDVGDHDGAALCAEPSGECTSDPHRSSRDDRDLPRRLHPPMLIPATDVLSM